MYRYLNSYNRTEIYTTAEQEIIYLKEALDSGEWRVFRFIPDYYSYYLLFGVNNNNYTKNKFLMAQQK